MIDEWFETVGNRPFRIINWLFTKQRQYFSPLWSWWASTHSKRHYREVEFTQLGPNIITHEKCQLVAMAAYQWNKWTPFFSTSWLVSCRSVVPVCIRQVAHPESGHHRNDRGKVIISLITQILNWSFNDLNLQYLSVYFLENWESKHQSWSWLVWWCQKTFT